MCDTIYMNRTNWVIHIFLNQEVVGKSDRTGDKTLNLQHFFAMSFGLSVENISRNCITAYVSYKLPNKLLFSKSFLQLIFSNLQAKPVSLK